MNLKLSTAILRGVASYWKKGVSTRKRGMSGVCKGASMVDMLQMLMEDSRRREAEITEERRYWEEERRRREGEYEEESIANLGAGSPTTR